MKYDKLCLFAGGLLAGTAGVAILGSKDAKKVYTHCTAAILRGKDSICSRYDIIKENCEDILSDAEDINARRYKEAAEQEVELARAIVEEYDNNKEAE